MQGTILTASGIERFLTATPEEQITITEFAVGDGGGPDNTVDPTMTELRNEKWRGEASAPMRDPDNPSVLTFETTIPANEGGFTIREIGLYDEMGDLVAVGITSETEKPSLSQAIGFTLTLRMHIALANDGDAELVVQDTGAVDHQGLFNRQAIDCHPAKSISIDEVSNEPGIKTVQQWATKVWATQQQHGNKLQQLQGDVEGALGTVTLVGDSLLYPDSSNEFTITNYDSFSVYEVTVSRCEVSRSGDKITVTVNPQGMAGELILDVKRDGHSNKYLIAVGEAGIQTPVITSPSSGATVPTLTPTFTTTPFVAYPRHADELVSVDWRFFSDAALTDVIWESLGDTDNLESITVPPATFGPSATIYAQVTHNGNTYVSLPSAAVMFKTPEQYINTPQITEPTEGETKVGEAPILRATPFSTTPEGIDTFKTRSWRIRRKTDGVVVWERLKSTTAIDSVAVTAGILKEDTEYEAQAKDEGYILGETGWSAPVAFTTDDQFVPDKPGAPFGGGYFGGQIKYPNGDIYALVIADKSAETSTTWKSANTATSGTTSRYDGLANSNAMNNSSHAAAKHCRDYRGGGFNDWYLPAIDELEIIYYNNKPSTNSNDTTYGNRDGNAHSIPPRPNKYSASVPAQTTNAAFRAGGAQAFNHTGGTSDYRYWTSTQDASTYSWTQVFGDGYQGYNSKNNTDRVRPVRRVKLN